MNTPTTSPTSPTAEQMALATLQPLNSDTGGLAPSAMMGDMKISISTQDMVAVKAADVELKLKKRLREAQTRHTTICDDIENLIARWNVLKAQTVAPADGRNRLEAIIKSLQAIDPTLNPTYQVTVSWPINLSFVRSDGSFNVPAPADLVNISISVDDSLHGRSHSTDNTITFSFDSKIPLPPLSIVLVGEARTLKGLLSVAQADIRDLRTQLSNIPAVQRQAQASLTRALMQGSNGGAALLRAMDASNVDDAATL